MCARNSASRAPFSATSAAAEHACGCSSGDHSPSLQRQGTRQSVAVQGLQRRVITVCAGPIRHANACNRVLKEIQNAHAQ